MTLKEFEKWSAMQLRRGSGKPQGILKKLKSMQ